MALSPKEQFFRLWEQECTEADEARRQPDADAIYARVSDAMADAADMARKARREQL